MPVVVLSRSGANCVNSACNRRSRSSTVASRLGPGGGGVFSFMGIMVVPSSVGLSSVATGVAGGLFIIGDRWRAAVSNIWNLEVNAAMIVAFFITVRIVSKYWEKQSSSTTSPSPAKQSIMCTITGRHHETRTGGSAGGSAHLHVVIMHGVRGALLDRPDRSDGTLLVPRLPQSSAPLSVTPICVVGRAPRVVLCPFRVRRP